MKRIFFIRHAKSSWKDGSLSDIDRPLNGRGRRDGPNMAKKLKKIIPDVDLIICSPARRAQETCKYFLDELNIGKKIINDAIYHAWTDTIIDEVRKIDDTVDTALIFGHNPGFTSVFNHFSVDHLDNLPTCGIFELRCSDKWKKMNQSNTTTGILIYPKMFNNAD